MHPEARYRNIPEAVELARRACEVSDWKSANIIATLAGAYLEAGSAEEGIRTAEQAQRVAEQNGQIEYAQQVAQKIAQYRAMHIER